VSKVFDTTRRMGTFSHNSVEENPTFPYRIDFVYTPNHEEVLRSGENNEISV
jgi:hypothetical protein